MRPKNLYLLIKKYGTEEDLKKIRSVIDDSIEIEKLRGERLYWFCKYIIYCAKGEEKFIFRPNRTAGYSKYSKIENINIFKETDDVVIGVTNMSPRGSKLGITYVIKCVDLSEKAKEKIIEYIKKEQWWSNLI